MLACVGPDGRIRGALQYHGAHTGRWTGRLLQPQNLPRPTIKITDPEALVAAVKTGNPDALRPWGDDPIQVLVSSLRHALVARDGAMLGSGDFATIEARIVLALAGQDDKVALLASGADVYRDMAADIYELDKAVFMAIEKDLLTIEQNGQRQVGKNTVLGCGFALWREKFAKMYCKHLQPKQREAFAKKVIDTYRKVWAPMVPQLWYDLERAATRAVVYPDKIAETECGVRYRLETRAGRPLLVCRLLNDKKLYYWNARIEERKTKWGNTKPGVVYDGVKNHQWRTGISASPGLLTENVVSALARELLVDAMFRFEERGFPVILTVHDEIVVEDPAITEELMIEIMSERPKWAVDLGVPIAVEAWVGKRYRK
jgi:DNA polymerase